MNKERGKSWELLQERGLELYEYIQQSLDPKTWEVPVESEGIQIPLEEFKKKARPRLDPYTSETSYSPLTVAKDSLVILDALETLFFNIRNRLEDSFKSVLIVNEDMNQFISGKEDEIESFDQRAIELEQENTKLREENDALKEQLKKKEQGIMPLLDILKLRMREIMKHYDEFLGCLGTEDMKKCLPILERDVEITKRLVDIRMKQLEESSIDYAEVGSVPFSSGGDGFLPPEKEDLVEAEEAGIEEVNPSEIPEKYQDIDPLMYMEAKKAVDKKRKPTWDDVKYQVELDNELNDLKYGSKAKKRR